MWEDDVPILNPVFQLTVSLTGTGINEQNTRPL